jgi:hypothetical protein
MSGDPASPPVAGSADPRPDRPAPAVDSSEAVGEQRDAFGGRPPAPPSGPARPGLGLFTIEGRAAPGLFVVGWLATLLGFGIVVVGAIAPSALFVYFVGPVLLSIGLIAGCSWR